MKRIPKNGSFFGVARNRMNLIDSIVRLVSFGENLPRSMSLTGRRSFASINELRPFTFALFI